MKLPNSQATKYQLTRIADGETVGNVQNGSFIAECEAVLGGVGRVVAVNFMQKGRQDLHRVVVEYSTCKNRRQGGESMTEIMIEFKGAVIV